MSVVVLPGLLLAIPSGVIISKIGFRKIGFLTLLGIALGNLVTASSNIFSHALLGRLIMGFGSSFLTIGSATILSNWFEKNQMGLVMGIYSIGYPVSTMVAFFVAPILGQYFGWQFVFYVGTMIAILFSIIFFIIIRDQPSEQKTKTFTLSNLLESLTKGQLWKILLTWMFFNIASTGFLTWAPTLFLRFKEQTLVYASIISSTYTLSRLVFVPFYGWISDKIGKRKLIIIMGLAVTSAILYSLNYLEGFSLILGVFLLGASTGTIPALVLALVPQTLPSNQTGVGFGLMSTSFRVAAIIGPPMTGLFIELTQSLTLTLLGLSIFPIISLFFAISYDTKRH
jgi:MFS family permease